MSPQPYGPDRDSEGNRLRPGDRVIFDALGRPLRVHPSRICRHCDDIREDGIVCGTCGAVSWRQPISSTMTTVILVGGAFVGRDQLDAPWSAIVFWVCLVLGGLWALNTLGLWNHALRGFGVRLGRIIGGALVCGGLGWLIDWWSVGHLNTWAVGGAVGGACLSLVVGLVRFWRDPWRD